MIGRYTLPEMGHLWSEAHKYELWCRVETLVLEAQAAAGTVPADAVAPVRAAPPPDPATVEAYEAVTDHDVIAFLSAWADNTSPREAAAFVHFGMTSSNLLDTAMALQLTEASDLLIARAQEWLAEAGAERVWSTPYRTTVSAGQHQAGTCRMGADPARSVTDPWGRVHGHRNLWVMDASVHVTNGGFNPVLTVFALAFRNARHLADVG